ncbi:DNA polymerase III subunit delta [Criblamydia sequanensis]|uniref:DNA-directed DNA polymerase n=1 Tax=Candidatus Criblamydia sequanensis CRIB-18 TaxID=1437425 RepID=A0A090D1Y1_9BACT|nr:hypothetical protein [Criblamydia sequanensis]CDR34160.1 DNA polymerase III subunit delta [Criblamydia sequanensis CRIB-18]
MKYDTVRGLEKHLLACKNSHFANCYFAIVEDAFDRRLVRKMILSSLSQNSLQVFLKGGELKPGFLREELLSQNLFSKRKTIVVDEAEKIPKPDIDLVIPFLEKRETNLSLVFFANSIRKDNRLYKVVEKYGVILDLPEEKPWQKEKNITGWLIEMAEGYQKKLSFDGAKKITASLGLDKELLHSELEKLVSYVGEKKEIQLKDVLEVSFEIPSDTAWQLGEAIFQRKASEAHQIVSNLLKNGTPPLQILKQIRSQFQTDFQVASLLSQGKRKEDISLEFPYMKGFILDQHIKASYYGLESFKKGFLAIDASDLELRNSSIDPEFSIEKLVLNLCIR